MKNLMKELAKLSKEQLIKMVTDFEHYPAVDSEDDEGYILAYLEDEACTLEEEDIAKYLFDNNLVQITQNNVQLFYKFMSEEEVQRHTDAIYHKSMYRACLVQLELSLTPRQLYINSIFENGYLFVFGVKDTMKSIEDYMTEIKKSEAYNKYVSSL